MAACAPRHPPEARAPRATALAVVAVFDSIAADTLWPGFRPGAVPLAIYDGARTWLVRYPHATVGFSRVDMGQALQVSSGRHPLMRANTTVEWDGVTTATLLLTPAVNDDPRSWAGIAIHESFHAYERERYRRWGADEAELFRYPVDDSAALGSRRIETETLRRALAAATDSAGACWAGRALEERRARFAVLGGQSATYERDNERFEGLADYVELRATGDTLRLPRGGYPAAVVRLRSYAIGTALALLLDRFHPGWRDDLDRDPSRHLDALLGDALPPTDSAACGASFDRDSVAVQAARDVRGMMAHRHTVREAFLRQEGWAVTVSAGRDRLRPEGFDPLNVEIISREELLHHRYLRLGTDSAWIELLDRQGLTTGTPPDALYGGVRSLLVTGLPSAPLLRDSAGVLLLKADGLQAAIAGGRVSWGDHTLHVTAP